MKEEFNLLQLLLAYLNTTRYEGPEIDNVLVEADATTLHTAISKKHGGEDKVFIQIFSERSKAHLAALGSAYRKMYGKFLGKVLH